jgi:hypothetical protein
LTQESTANAMRSVQDIGGNGENLSAGSDPLSIDLSGSQDRFPRDLSAHRQHGSTPCQLGREASCHREMRINAPALAIRRDARAGILVAKAPADLGDGESSRLGGSKLPT